ncbi:MAG: hypothetical protein JNL82_14515 [Myxococcales bacterium]|nr:hypothetical protein [Myxococcales bacterium]
MPLTAAALELLLPPGGERYIGLLLAEPDAEAGTYVELADSAYGRQLNDAWVTEDNGDGRLRRRNNGAHVWNPIADAPVEITHWGIFDLEFDGVLLAFGPMLNGAGDAEPAPLEIGDEFRFNDNTLALLNGC